MNKRFLYFRITVLLVILLSLPLLLVTVKEIQKYLTRAAGKNAALVVDTQLKLGKMRPFWNSYAQGGEESGDMIGPVVSELSRLAPNYIRIDHVFDHFDMVGRSADGSLTYNFSKLDVLIGSIVKTGARPFIALSYMPPVIAENGDITAKPKNWNEWQEVVMRLVEHVSGRSELNLSQVYYEVWNEPDLFGKWKYTGDKNYLTLYAFAVRGAQKAQGVNSFKIGGPATTALYKNWLTALANSASRQKLRLDFFSWHRYTTNPTDYNQDVRNVTNWLFYNPEYISLPRLITEWGFDSNTNPGYDGLLAAAHALSSIRQAMYGYEQLFAFEVVDGLSENSKPYWGRWGLITHPKTGKLLKPRYAAFTLANLLQGTRLSVTGEGTWVSAIAAKTDETVRILVTNYDPESRHTEETPLTITGLVNGEYLAKRTRLAQDPVTEKVKITQNTYQTQIVLPANAVILLEITPEETNPFLLPLPSGN